MTGVQTCALPILFTLNDITGQSISITSKYLFKMLNLAESLKIDEKNVKNFFLELEKVFNI